MENQFAPTDEQLLALGMESYQDGPPNHRVTKWHKVVKNNTQLVDIGYVEYNPASTTWLLHIIVPPTGATTWAGMDIQSLPQILEFLRCVGSPAA